MTTNLDLPIEIDEVAHDGGWYLVQWKDGCRTYFRHGNSAVALAQRIDSVTVVWVPIIVMKE